MTTVHHPPLKGLSAHHDPNWLWIGLTVVMVVLIMAAITWTMTCPTATETASVQHAIDIEAELDNEMTAAQFATPGVTTDYFGATGLPEAEWVRELAVSNAIALNLFNGMEPDHEVTAFHFAEPGVTVLYFGDPGLLNPDHQ